jgi:hypothetical protein
VPAVRKRIFVRSSDSDSDDSLAEPDLVAHTMSDSEDTVVQNVPTVRKRSYCYSDNSEDSGDNLAKNGLLLFTKKRKTSSCKNIYDKTQFCTFCGKRNQSKISRHLLTVHKNETKVRDILLLPKQSSQRIKLLQILANEGNFKHNVAALQKGEGEIVVARRSTLKWRKASDFTACEFCKKWVAKKNMWRHSQSCLLRAEYYNTHSRNNKKRMVVKHGQAIVNNAVYKDNEDITIELLLRMRDDEIKEIVVADELIRREAGLRMTALGRKVDQKLDNIYRVSQSARTLGRIVLQARQHKPGITLDGLIEPSNFDLVVDIAKKMSTEKEVPSLNVGKTLGNLLGKVCQSKYCVALRQGNNSAQQDATNFKKLVEAEWNSRVNRAAVRRINREKRTKMPAIPLTEDLLKFRDYVIRNIKESSKRLRKWHNPQDWVLLAKSTMSRLILFNKRRRAEVRERRVDEYLARPNWKDDNSGEMALALSKMDHLLAKR